MSCGPLVVGPTRAVEISPGAGVMKDRSFSLENTPGDKILSAIVGKG
jgi:hypothetical protein